jgi:hypothetical protein
MTLTGFGNTATVDQSAPFGTFNESEILVDGAGNNIQVRQGDDNSFASENNAMIAVAGASNSVSVTQIGHIMSNTSDVNIAGNGNTAVIVQSAGP